MGTIIRSNGSKWAGQKPDSLEKLLEVLNGHPLRREFEAYGDFIERDPRNAKGESIGGLMGLAGESVSFSGNFHNLSHVFHIVSDDVDVIARLTAAIEANKQRPDYLRQPPPFRRDRLTIDRKRFSETQGEVLLTYDGARLEQFGDDIQLTPYGWQGKPDSFWENVARDWLVRQHAEKFARESVA